MMNKDDLLLKILPAIPAHGWTRAAVAAAGIDGPTFETAFPGGIAALVDHFADWADRMALAKMGEIELKEFKIRDQIALLVRARLEVLAPYEEAVRKEAAYLALSGRPDLGPRLVWRTASRLWYAAGDTSTDFNYYSKRGLLAGVITTTTLCWLADSSPDKEDSWAFLERRIENVMQFGKALAAVKKFADPGVVFGWFRRV
jgi:ubiquinone biosynthesis protein COQ9